MLKLKLFLLFFSVTGILAAQENTSDSAFLSQWLDKLPDATVTEIDHHPHFKSAWQLDFVQPVDHNNPDGATFTQRVFLFHYDFSRPVVFVTEGYSASHALRPQVMYELAGLLDANQIIVEHRYFEESVPEPLDWQYLTIKQAANDHHRVVQLFKGLYRDKWLNTGISKGGQTVMYHRYFFPDDVDVSVGYVCPLNFSIEDSRIYTFMEEVGSEECREKIYEYQVELLKNKDQFFPHFEKLAEEKNLEYSFAFWQWGRWKCDVIPETDTKPEKMVEHLDQVAGIDWLSDGGIDRFRPFYYQALTEIGFYGYDVDPFKEWVDYDHDITFTFTAPEGVECVYNPEPMKKVDKFIRHDARNMMFIYGETDPWSAPKVQTSGANNVVNIINPGGAHGTRIRNLPDELQQQVYELLEEWMEVEIKDKR
jgi:hypothetical protein